jgi:DNA (cytosine-5)-methyltransferase 1
VRPLALDLFCKAGGASMGLYRAGFDVIGVDIEPQPRYPFRFVQADALRPPFDLRGFDFIWASPPCQAFVSAVVIANKERAKRGKPHVVHRDRIPETRALLLAAGVPFCIENVPGAPLRRCLALTGDMFGLNTYRRRYFETSFLVLAPQPGPRFGPKTKPGACLVVGRPGGTSLDKTGKRWSHGNHGDWQKAMGIDWMTGREMANAVPPAYSEFIGRAAMQWMGNAA